MNESKRIYDANRAQEVLENEAFIKAFEDIKQELTEQWMTSPARDEAGREKLWLMLKMLEKVHLCLTNSLQDGRLAAKDLEHRRTIAERAKDWLGAS